MHVCVGHAWNVNLCSCSGTQASKTLQEDVDGGQSWERGERQEKKRLVSSTKKSMSQVIQDSLFNHVYGVFVLDNRIL